MDMDQSIAVPPASMQPLRLPEHVSLAGAGSASQHAYNDAMRYQRHGMGPGHPQDSQIPAAYHDPQRPRGMPSHPAERPPHMHAPPPGYSYGYHDHQADYGMYHPRMHGDRAADPAAAAFQSYPAAAPGGRKRALSPGPASMPPQRAMYAQPGPEGARHAPQPAAGAWQQPQQQMPPMQQHSELPLHQRVQAEQAAAAAAPGPSTSKRPRPSNAGPDDDNPLGLGYIPRGRRGPMQTNQHSGRQEAAPVQPAHDPAVQPAHDPYYRPPPGPGGYAYNRRPPPDWEAGRAPGGYYPPDAAGYQPSERAMAQEYRTAEGAPQRPPPARPYPASEYPPGGHEPHGPPGHEQHAWRGRYPPHYNGAPQEVAPGHHMPAEGPAAARSGPADPAGPYPPGPGQDDPYWDHPSRRAPPGQGGAYPGGPPGARAVPMPSGYDGYRAGGPPGSGGMPGPAGPVARHPSDQERYYQEQQWARGGYYRTEEPYYYQQQSGPGGPGGPGGPAGHWSQPGVGGYSQPGLEEQYAPGHGQQGYEDGQQQPGGWPVQQQQQQMQQGGAGMSAGEAAAHTYPKGAAQHAPAAGMGASSPVGKARAGAASERAASSGRANRADAAASPTVASGRHRHAPNAAAPLAAASPARPSPTHDTTGGSKASLKLDLAAGGFPAAAGNASTPTSQQQQHQQQAKTPLRGFVLDLGGPSPASTGKAEKPFGEQGRSQVPAAAVSPVPAPAAAGAASDEAKPAGDAQEVAGEKPAAVVVKADSADGAGGAGGASDQAAAEAEGDAAAVAGADAPEDAAKATKTAAEAVEATDAEAAGDAAATVAGAEAGAEAEAASEATAATPAAADVQPAAAEAADAADAAPAAATELAADADQAAEAEQATEAEAAEEAPHAANGRAGTPDGIPLNAAAARAVSAAGSQPPPAQHRPPPGPAPHQQYHPDPHHHHHPHQPPPPQQQPSGQYYPGSEQAYQQPAPGPRWQPPGAANYRGINTPWGTTYRDLPAMSPRPDGPVGPLRGYHTVTLGALPGLRSGAEQEVHELIFDLGGRQHHLGRFSTRRQLEVAQNAIVDLTQQMTYSELEALVTHPGQVHAIISRALQQDRAAQHAPAQAPPPRASGPGPSYHGPPAPHGTGHAGPSAAAAAAGGPHAEGSGDLAEGDAGSDDEGVGSGELGSSLLPNPMRDGVAPGITQVITSVPQEILKLVKKIPAGVQSSCKRHWQAHRSVDVTCGNLTGRFHMDPNGVCYVTYEDKGTNITAYPTSFMRAAGKMTMKKWKLAIRTAQFHRQLKSSSALMTIGEFLHAAGQHAVAK